MKHLLPAEIVDALDGALAPERQAHATACARCREELAGARAALRAAEEGELTGDEPSPLFWDHFSARLRRAIDAEGAPRAGSRRWIPAASLAALLIAAVAAGLIWSRGTGLPSPPASRSQQASAPTPAVPSDAAHVDEGWTFVADAADDLAWDDVERAGFVVDPGTAEHAASLLSGDQRLELVRLLQEEIDRLKTRG